MLSNGDNAIISSVEVEYLDVPQTTYNLEVEDFHTYYVGTEGILVHNICRGAQRSSYWKERAGSSEALQMYGKDNLRLMAQGKAPIGADGHKMVLHHVEGIKNNFGFFVEMTRTDHILFHRMYGYKNFISIFETEIPFFYSGG